MTLAVLLLGGSTALLGTASAEDLANRKPTDAERSACAALRDVFDTITTPTTTTPGQLPPRPGISETRDLLRASRASNRTSNGALIKKIHATRKTFAAFLIVREDWREQTLGLKNRVATPKQLTDAIDAAWARFRTAFNGAAKQCRRVGMKIGS
jgi:hypothetical protein